MKDGLDPEQWSILKRASFPEWVSDSALYNLEKTLDLWGADENGIIENAAEKQHLGEWSKQLQQYLKLFKSEKMKYCWEKAGKFRLIPRMEGQLWLSICLWDAFPHITSRYVAEKEALQWSEKLRSTLQNARKLAYNTPVNMVNWVPRASETTAQAVILASGAELLGAESSERETFTDRLRHILPYPHEIIDLWIDAIEKTSYDAYFFAAHVNGADAARAHFVRSLTCALKQDIGQPLRKLVAISASIAFDRNTSERQVSRLTSGLDWEAADRTITKVQLRSHQDDTISPD